MPKFGMIEDVKPMSPYERQALLNKSVRAPTDFDCSDDEFFDGNSRTVRLRPPNAGTRHAKVVAIEMLGLHPMILVMRTPVTAKPRAVAVLALNDVEREQVLAELPRMGTDEILDLIRGSPKTLHRAPIRWFPLD